MSRIAKEPVELPKGVEFRQDGNVVTLKGGKGELSLVLNSEVELKQDNNVLSFAPRSGSRFATAVAGTMRSIIANMAQGVSEGFERKLELVGVGYRAQAQGKKLSLSLGFSHPVEYTVPDAITVETPSQTEIIVKGADKQQVGQVASEIRRFRPPEPYKGKGVRYAGERVSLKEAKKK
ncbi:MAG: 50S ribosomal protein L6 [Gammaproteobacteria bacterium]|nr:50S ribosomal protein L6 [Gammaproteobacteria bacterium]MDH3480855.1 50S ribosomal protein L6 [Gammaproteobacteria bacterium]